MGLVRLGRNADLDFPSPGVASEIDRDVQTRIYKQTRQSSKCCTLVDTRPGDFIIMVEPDLEGAKFVEISESGEETCPDC